MQGSSPLARGLPIVKRLVPRDFKDHPRSRGVYLGGGCLTCSFRTGSSPLARGLLVVWLLWVRRLADHPRSRGVYNLGPEGSRTLLWIIPARAGFTGAACYGAAPGSDHPRSRGVYHSRRRRRNGQGGSSPLARGLHRGCPHSRVHAGIIPARAGFTGGRGRRPSCLWDHPRSRGVYPSRTTVPHHHPGSSPLARGLLSWGGGGPLVGGIIPARAGFTSSPVSSSRR